MGIPDRNKLIEKARQALSELPSVYLAVKAAELKAERCKQGGANAEKWWAVYEKLCSRGADLSSTIRQALHFYEEDMKDKNGSSNTKDS